MFSCNCLNFKQKIIYQYLLLEIVYKNQRKFSQVNNSLNLFISEKMYNQSVFNYLRFHTFLYIMHIFI